MLRPTSQPSHASHRHSRRWPPKRCLQRHAARLQVRPKRSQPSRPCKTPCGVRRQPGDLPDSAARCPWKPGGTVYGNQARPTDLLMRRASGIAIPRRWVLAPSNVPTTQPSPAPPLPGRSTNTCSSASTSRAVAPSFNAVRVQGRARRRRLKYGAVVSLSHVGAYNRARAITGDARVEQRERDVADTRRFPMRTTAAGV